MTEFSELKDKELSFYVNRLNWTLPDSVQQEAIRVLSSLPPEKADWLLPPCKKECWENGVAILKAIGYPRNKKALPKLARLLQDRNWPGALEAIEIFKGLDKEISTPYIEDEVKEALQRNDSDWLEHLEYACDDLGLDERDFQEAGHYLQMEVLAEK